MTQANKVVLLLQRIFCMLSAKKFRYFSGALVLIGTATVLGFMHSTPRAEAATTYTAGRTTIGSSTFTGQHNVVSATQARTGAVGGTLTSMSVYVKAVHAAPLNQMQVALYADNGSGAPGVLIAQSTSKALQTNSWNTFSMPSTALAANTDYWLAFNVNGSSTQLTISSVSGSRTAWRYPVTFASWPPSFGSPSRPIESKQYAAYLTYSSDETTPPPPEGTPGCGLPATPGVTTRILTVNGVERTYLVSVPSGLNPDVTTPVIMGFHGGSSTSAAARSSYGLEGSEPVIYVYPQAPYWPEAGGVAWDVNPAGIDFPYVDALFEDLKNKHCVDTNRVFATGKSNGGFFVNALACLRPNIIRALASVAGGGPSSACAQPKAAMIVHGSGDTIVPLATGIRSRDYWLAANQYASTPPVSVTPPPCVSYPGTINPVVWCEHSGGHTWPSWTGAAVRSFFLSL